MATDPTATVCTEWVQPSYGSFGGHACGRKVKEDGLCGLHLGALKRRREAEAKRKVQYKRSSENRVIAQNLLGSLGIEGTPQYSSMRREYTGDIVISQEELLRAWNRDPNG